MPSRQFFFAMMLLCLRAGRVDAQALPRDSWLTQQSELSREQIETLATTCPTWLHLGARVTALLGHEPEASVHFSTTLLLRTSASDNRYEVRVWRDVSSSPREVRVLSDESCEALSEAVAVVIALTLDRNATQRTLAEESRAAIAPENARENTTEPAATSTQQHGREQVPRSPWQDPTPMPLRSRRFLLTLSLAGVAHSHLLPRLGLGGAFDVGTAMGPVELHTGFSLLAPVTTLNDGRVGAEIGAWSIFVRAGYSFALSQHFSLVPSAALETGELFGQGIGVTPSRRGSAPWFAVAVAGELRWHPLDVFGLFVRVAPRLIPVRPIFYLEGVGDVFQPYIFDVSVTLGIRAALPM